MANFEELSLLEKIEKLKSIEIEFHKMINDSEAKKITADQFINDFVRLSTDGVELKNLIELELAKQDIANLEIQDDSIKDILNRIVENKKLISVNAYKVCNELMNEKKNGNNLENKIDELDFSMFNFENLFEDFHSWFDVGDFYYRRLKIGPIVTSKSIPSKYINYFKEIRDAYSYGLEKSCIALCRALLEMCLLEKLNEIKDFKEKLSILNKTSNRKDFSLCEYINAAYKYKLIDSNLKNMAHGIRKKAINILHDGSKDCGLDNLTDFEIIKNSVLIVEHLYS